ADRGEGGLGRAPDESGDRGGAGARPGPELRPEVARGDGRSGRSHGREGGGRPGRSRGGAPGHGRGTDHRRRARGQGGPPPSPPRPPPGRPATGRRGRSDRGGTGRRPWPARSSRRRGGGSRRGAPREVGREGG